MFDLMGFFFNVVSCVLLIKNLSEDQETLLQRQPAFQPIGQSDARTTGSMNQVCGGS